MFLYVAFLRLIHILGGVLWVGGDLVYFGFIEPVARKLGPESAKFMEFLMARQKLPIALSWSSRLTVLSGALLFLRDSDMFRSMWMTSTAGIGFGIGALLGIAAMLQGEFVLNPTAKRMGQVGASIQGMPTPEQAAELNKLGARMTKVGLLETVLSVSALAVMATARYWIF